MSTFTTRILRRTELRSDTPLSKVIESFFIHNGMAAKTKEFYRGNFNAYAAWVKERTEVEPSAGGSPDSPSAVPASEVASTSPPFTSITKEVDGSGHATTGASSVQREVERGR